MFESINYAVFVTITGRSGKHLLIILTPSRLTWINEAVITGSQPSHLACIYCGAFLQAITANTACLIQVDERQSARYSDHGRACTAELSWAWRGDIDFNSYSNGICQKFDPSKWPPLNVLVKNAVSRARKKSGQFQDVTG